MTERLVHPGALVGRGADAPLLVIQQISHLRLVVAVPEEMSAASSRGASVPFRVPAFPERTYSGTVARIAHVLDPKTRTMAVELDVANRDGSLSPGMYPAVKWPVRRAQARAVRSEDQRGHDHRAHLRDPQPDGPAEWVDVKKGAADGDLIEVIGNLKPGDRVVKRGSDEIRDGARL